jgi:hypothetical protein
MNNLSWLNTFSILIGFIFFEDLNQKKIYLLVTSFDIYKPNITKPIIIITINCGMIGVTI